MAWFDSVKDLVGIGLALLAIIVSLVTVLISRRQQQTGSYLAIQELMLSDELQRGRLLIYESGVSGRIPPVGTADYYRIVRALAVFDLLGAYARKGIVRREWVLDYWHPRLQVLRSGYELVNFRDDGPYPLIGVRAACRATGRAQARHYRRHRQSPALARPVRERRAQPRALSEVERDTVRALLNSPDYVDKAPATVYHELLDEGTYVASVSSMYRILRSHGEVIERRRQAVHPARVKPELVATAPNQCWSWDITKLHGPAKWSYFHLYVIIDIYSRYTVGWLIADRESAALAEQSLADTIAKQNVDRDTLTIHADNGSSMASKPAAFLLADLGVTKSHSRPHTSNDNPFSESQFRTLKYRPEFPATFASLAKARAFCRRFFSWYNSEHRHSGIAWHTPHNVHYGQTEQVRAVRADVLTAAYTRNPERFVRKPPEPASLPVATWINKPAEQDPDGPAHSTKP